VPQSFLSVFRGRAGMIDCSFDMDKGAAFTRSMHKDTMYYFVYKGKELKGYVGLMKGVVKDSKSNNGKKVLVVDTVNSPSLDGAELLTNLFYGLNDLARKMGMTGVVVPQDMDPSFNFDNKKTISKLSFYIDGEKVTVKPEHEESWNIFTAAFGKDSGNSIESGEFVLLKLLPLADRAMSVGEMPRP